MCGFPFTVLSSEQVMFITSLKLDDPLTKRKFHSRFRQTFIEQRVLVGNCFTVKKKPFNQPSFFMSLVSGQLLSESMRICATLIPLKRFLQAINLIKNMFTVNLPDNMSYKSNLKSDSLSPWTFPNAYIHFILSI